MHQNALGSTPIGYLVVGYTNGTADLHMNISQQCTSAPEVCVGMAPLWIVQIHQNALKYSTHVMWLLCIYQSPSVIQCTYV